MVSTRFSKWGCANATLFLWKGCQVQKILGTYAQSLQSLSTLPFTNTRMNTPILLPVTIYCTCQSGAAEITAPGSQPNIDIGKSAKQTSQAETLALNGGWHAWATTTILMRLFFDWFYEVFPKRKRKLFRNENKFYKNGNVLSRKHLRNKKSFQNESKIVFVFETSFLFVFFKKMRETNLFRVSCLGHRIRAATGYLTTLLRQNSGQQNGFISRMLFSKLYNIMVNKVTFVGFRGDRPNRPLCIHPCPQM